MGMDSLPGQWSLSGDSSQLQSVDWEGSLSGLRNGWSLHRSGMEECRTPDSFEKIMQLINAEEPSWYLDNGLGAQGYDLGHINNKEGKRPAQNAEEARGRPLRTSIGTTWYRRPSPLPRADSILSQTSAIKPEAVSVCVKERIRKIEESWASPRVRAEGSQTCWPNEQRISCRSRQSELFAGHEKSARPSINGFVKGGASARGPETGRKYACRTLQEIRPLKGTDVTGNSVEATRRTASSREDKPGSAVRVDYELLRSSVSPPPYLAYSEKIKGVAPISPKHSAENVVSQSLDSPLSLSCAPLGSSPVLLSSVVTSFREIHQQPSPPMSFLVDRGYSPNIISRPQSPIRQSMESSAESSTLERSSTSSGESMRYSFYADSNDIMSHAGEGGDRAATCMPLHEKSTDHLYNTSCIDHKHYSGCRVDTDECPGAPLEARNTSSPGQQDDVGPGGLAREGIVNSNVIVGGTMSLLAAVMQRRKERKRCVTIVEPTAMSSPPRKISANRILLKKKRSEEELHEPSGQGRTSVQWEKKRRPRPLLASPHRPELIPASDSLPVLRARKPAPSERSGVSPLDVCFSTARRRTLNEATSRPRTLTPIKK